MSYSFGWQVPERVVLFTLGEIYTLEDAGLLNKQMLELLENSTQPLHMLVDLNQLRQYPKRVTEEVWSITKCLRHQQMGWMVIINDGANPMAHLIATVVGKTTGVKMRFVKSPDEAVETLHRMDLTLQPA
jgi:hypothetical protein